MAQPWPHLRRAALQPAQADRRRQRRQAGPGLVLGSGKQPWPGGHPAGVRRRALRLAVLEPGDGRGPAQRQAPVAVRSPGGSRPLPLHLLRRGQPRRRPVERQGLRRRTGRSPDRPGRQDRPRGLERADHRPGQALQHHRRAACGEGQGDHRQRRRRVRRARLLLRLRCRDRQDGLALLHRAGRPGPALRAPRTGRSGQDLEGRPVLETRRRRYRMGQHGLRPGAGPAVHRHR